MYKYLKGGCEGERYRFFLVMLSDGTRGNGHEQKHRKFHPSIRNMF